MGGETGGMGAYPEYEGVSRVIGSVLGAAIILGLASLYSCITKEDEPVPEPEQTKVEKSYNRFDETFINRDPGPFTPTHEVYDGETLFICPDGVTYWHDTRGTRIEQTGVGGTREIPEGGVERPKTVPSFTPEPYILWFPVNEHGYGPAIFITTGDKPIDPPMIASIDDALEDHAA
jgi:hypothetical protein